MPRLLIAVLLSILACVAVVVAAEPQVEPSCFDNSGREDAWQGGVRMIPIHMPHGDFKAWTKGVGNAASTCSTIPRRNGFGLRRTEQPVTHCTDRAERWLSATGILKGSTAR